MTAASSLTPSGSLCRELSAKGTRTYSAWVPLMRWPKIQPMPEVPSSSRQCAGSCWWQYEHEPHEVMQEMITRSPTASLLTAWPTSVIVPTPSCPRIRPSVTAGTSPLRMCRSVPQIVVVSTCTITSVGSMISGSGASSHAFSPGPWYTSAFIS